MKIILNIIFSLILVGINACANADSLFAQIASTQTQLSGITGGGLIVMDSLVGSSHGLQMNAAKNNLIFTASGVYFIIAAGQVGSRDKENEKGYVDLWLIKNGKSIANSNTRQATGPNFTTVLVLQTVMQINAGDAIGFKFSGSRPSLGLIAVPATANEPTIPSVIISIFKISAN